MAAGVTDRLWEMVDVVDVLDAFEAKRKRGAKPIIRSGAMGNWRRLLRARHLAGWHRLIGSKDLRQKAMPDVGLRTNRLFG